MRTTLQDAGKKLAQLAIQVLRDHKWRWLRRLAVPPLVLIASFHLLVVCGEFPEDSLAKSRVQSLTIRSAEGHLLGQRASALGQKKRWTSLDEISPHLIHATLASEDANFYEHDGVDWSGIARASWLNLRGGKLAYGGSTITMQLTRLLTGTERSLWGKLEQSVLASRLERRLSKEEILEHYLNRVFYGHRSWGAEQASQYYFGKTASELSVGEAATLAVFPRGPEYYDVDQHLGRVQTRRNHILKLMHKREYITRETLALASSAPISFAKHPSPRVAPHFATFAESKLGNSFRRGGDVITTLDIALQTRAEEAVRRHVRRLRHRNVTQAAVVVLRNSDGAILAMVGSEDFADTEHNGAFNGATARLRPGSTLKPFVYGAALEQGDTPASMALDLILPEDVGRFYSKEVKQHGPARYREALAGSYNLSAVHALQRAGRLNVLSKLRRAGLLTLDRPDADYNDGLAIGHAEVTLLDLTAAFTTFGRGGTPVRPRAILSGVDAASAGPAIFSEHVNYQIFDILSDPDARKPMFGDHVPLNLGFPIALKTGTTKAYTDLWAIGTTAEYTVGVWAGNFDGSPSHQVMSVDGATPLLSAVFSNVASLYGTPTAPQRPSGLVESEICPFSGKAPGPHCPHRKKELFLEKAIPHETCSSHVMQCGQVVTRYPELARSWAQYYGLEREPICKGTIATDSELRILRPQEGARFVLEPHRSAQQQRPPLIALPSGDHVQWLVDGVPAHEWTPRPGRFEVVAIRGSERASVSIWYQ